MPVTEYILTEQEVFEYLEILENKIDKIPTHAPPALLLSEDLKVCPQGFISMDIANLLNLHANCSEYHVPPYDSVWLKNPELVIEAFDAIKEGSSLQTRHSMAEAERKSQEGPKTVPIGRNRNQRG
jgi:hypothetical protein